MTNALLYLDFDGVLQSQHVYRHPSRGIYIDEKLAPGRTMFEWTPLLVEALQAAPSVGIVLSTSWVREFGYTGAMKHLPKAVAARVVGATYHSRHHGRRRWQREAFAAIPRGLQVLADVERRRPLAWCALDDEVEGWPSKHRDKLVACDGDKGLSDEAVRSALVVQLNRLQAVVEGVARPRLSPTA